MSRMPEDTDRGLSVRRSPGTAPGWRVVHDGSGLSAGVTLKYQKEARQFRAELLATGCDFTRPYGRGDEHGNPGRLQLDPRWEASRQVMQSWQAKDITPRYDPFAPRMTFCCTRNGDGLIHVTNILAGMTGQHHVHDDESFAAWRAGISDEDILWDNGKVKRTRSDKPWQHVEPHCPCGLTSGQSKDGA